jgi:hypothetical protein
MLESDLLCISLAKIIVAFSTTISSVDFFKCCMDLTRHLAYVRVASREYCSYESGNAHGVIFECSSDTANFVSDFEFKRSSK